MEVEHIMNEEEIKAAASRKTKEQALKSQVGYCERLLGLAEECCELAQAALKLRRCFEGDNPTPKSEEECIEALYEEVADVELYLDMLDLNWVTVRNLSYAKFKRWLERLGITDA